MTSLSESVRADIDAAAAEIVAGFPPLTGEQLTEISRLFTGTNVPQSAGGSAGRGGSQTPAAPVRPPRAGVAGPAHRHTSP